MSGEGSQHTHHTFSSDPCTSFNQLVVDAPSCVLLVWCTYYWYNGVHIAEEGPMYQPCVISERIINADARLDELQ